MAYATFISIVLSTLCTSVTQMREYTCPGDEMYMKGMAPSEARKERFKQLGLELKEEIFKVATMENMPLSGINATNKRGAGTAFDFFDILEEKYGFKYEVVPMNNKSLSLESDGIMSKLRDQEIDIGVAFLPVITAFKGVVEYSRALDEGDWVMLMKRPQESATGSGLWAPFTLEVWLLILLSLIVVGPIIYGLIMLEVKLCREAEFPLYPLPACVWFVYGALLKQGSTLSPITDSSRMLFATWWIFITILTAFYTANLTAFLTLSKFTLPITKPEDIGRKHYSWVYMEGTAAQQSMTNKDSTLATVTLGSTMELITNMNETDVLAEWVFRRNYMFLGEKPTVEYLMYDDYRQKVNIPEDKRCTFVITPFTVVTYPRAFAYRKGFKYFELFDEVIQHLFESGIVKYKLREKLPNTEICPMNLGSKERQLRNSDLFMTYALVGAGFACAFAVFLLEQLHRCFGKRSPPTHAEGAVKLNNFFSDKSILRSNKRDGKFKFATFTDNNNVKGTLWHEMNTGAPPPPPYHALFQPPFPNSPNGAKKNINGRDYWIVKSVYGETKLIPVRTPSALLFQYNNN